jgi:hypothetical protein
MRATHTERQLLFHFAAAVRGTHKRTQTAQGGLLRRIVNHNRSGMLAGNAGVSAEQAAKEWTANVIPGITIIPSGTWGVNRAQEGGCTYCAGG